MHYAFKNSKIEHKLAHAALIAIRFRGLRTREIAGMTKIFDLENCPNLTIDGWSSVRRNTA